MRGFFELVRNDVGSIPDVGGCGSIPGVGGFCRDRNVVGSIPDVGGFCFGGFLLKFVKVA